MEEETAKDMLKAMNEMNTKFDKLILLNKTVLDKMDNM